MDISGEPKKSPKFWYPFISGHEVLFSEKVFELKNRQWSLKKAKNSDIKKLGNFDCGGASSVFAERGRKRPPP